MISLGAKVIDTTQMRGDRLNSILKPIKEADDGDILFFDEIHTLPNKVLEGLYYVIDKGTFYDTDLCLDLPLPKVKFAFATNIINSLPVAFLNRCKFVELQEYTQDELKLIIGKRYPEIEKDALESIVKASKGVPRTALSLAKSIIAGAMTEKYKNINQDNVNSLLDSRFKINSQTGLNEREFKLISKIVERGNISSTGVANLLGCSLKDAKQLYIEPLRAAGWLAVSNHGVTLGMKGHLNYRVFMKKAQEEI